MLLRDRLPASLSWDRLQANQARLAASRNLPRDAGAPRNGPAVLAGLVRCGRWGRRRGRRGPKQRVSYTGTAGRPAVPGVRAAEPAMGLARRLGINRDRVRRWMRVGGLNLRRDEDGHQVIGADASELRRRRERHALPQTWANKKSPAKRKKPKPRPAR